VILKPYSGTINGLEYLRDGKGIYGLSFLATASLGWGGERYLLREVAGPCNATPPPAILKTLRRWLRENKAVPAPERPERDDWNPFAGDGPPPAADGPDDLDAIPF
jgi:hypothetical protein